MLRAGWPLLRVLILAGQRFGGLQVYCRIEYIGAGEQAGPLGPIGTKAIALVHPVDTA